MTGNTTTTRTQITVYMQYNYENTLQILFTVCTLLCHGTWYGAKVPIYFKALKPVAMYCLGNAYAYICQEDGSSFVDHLVLRRV